jgi:hypothetical protein
MEVKAMTAGQIQKFFSDIRKAHEADLIMFGTELIQQNLQTVIRYQLKQGITIEDFNKILIMGLEPEISSVLAKMMDDFNKENRQAYSSSTDNYNTRKKSSSSSSNERCYAGVYNSLSEVPGYGTEWNDRCKPEGVIIRNANERC